MDQTTPSKPAPAAPGAPAAAQRPVPAWLMALLLALFALALYWPATQHDFTNFDDNSYVTANAHVQAGLTPASLKWAFTSVVLGNWHPITMLSHMLDCQLYGLKPWGHHLTNILLHALNTALVFLLLRGMTGAQWRSALVAALFAAHPLHVESVAWVAERKDVLSAFFGLLALIFYVRYAQSKVQSPRSKVQGPKVAIFNYSLALVFFALGLMSKPMLVTLPFLLLLLDYWPLQRFNTPTLQHSNTPTTLFPLSVFRYFSSPVTRHSSLLLEKIPFFVLAAASSVVTFLVQRHTGAVMTVAQIPMALRMENALISYCRYLGKLCWPTDLAAYYPYPEQWPPEEVLAAGVLLCGITGLFVWGRRRWPFLLMGWLWFVGTLVPVIGLVQAGAQSMADRYAYIPSLGVFILAVWGAYELAMRWGQQMAGWAVAGLAVMVACVLLTRQQLGYWQDSETIFRHTLAVTENNELAHNDLAIALMDKGQTGEAISQYREAIRLNPNLTELHGNLGGALLKQGLTNQAMEQFQEAVRLAPDSADPHVDLGVALLDQGQVDEAIKQLQTAVRLKPDHANAHFNLGVALSHQGKNDEAIGQFQEAIRLDPKDAPAHNSLGNVLMDKGSTAAAVEQFQAALRLEPDYTDAQVNLGVALLREGQTDDAIAQFRQALRLAPDNAYAHFNLGDAFFKESQADEAITQFQADLRLNPNDADAQKRLALAVALKQKLDSMASDPAGLNNAAWELATSPDATARNGAAAVTLAERACEQTQYRVTVMVGTLAAAYAEAGRYDEAVATGQKACALAEVQGQTNLLARNRELTALYQKHQPYHEPAKAGDR